jgi:hypothetical protein
MKKYLLVVAAGLLTTAAVTATVLDEKDAKNKAAKETKKIEKKKSCNKEKTSCFFS